jgi:hypothetical protein
MSIDLELLAFGKKTPAFGAAWAVRHLKMRGHALHSVIVSCMKNLSSPFAHLSKISEGSNVATSETNNERWNFGTLIH